MVQSATSTLVRPGDQGASGPANAYPEARATEPSTVPAARVFEVGRRARGHDAKTRVLVVFEEDFRSYREAIACALKSLRPRAEVTVAELGKLEAEIERVGPDLVICSQPNAGDSSDRFVWVEVPSDPNRPSAICLEGRCSKTNQLTLDDLLSIVDAAEAFSRARSTGDLSSRLL
jgi:hypothetical protein